MSGSKQPKIRGGGQAETAQVVPLRESRGDPPDARLVEFVRLLARQAARDYHEQTRRDAEHPGN